MRPSFMSPHRLTPREFFFVCVYVCMCMCMCMCVCLCVIRCCSSSDEHRGATHDTCPRYGTVTHNAPF